MSKANRFLPIQVLAIGFGIIIFIGSVLLSMPFCSNDGKGLPFINSLFTATSATCVTGLVVYDTYSQFNFLGQLIILLLIQIGGLGFMGISMAFSFFIGSKITISQRFILMESIGALHFEKIIITIRRMFIGTLIFEGIGALILSSRFIPKIGLMNGLWYGIFHSVSAFCNAGFDLMGRFAPGSSLTLFQTDFLFQNTIMFLILSGGIGFIVWNDIVSYKLKFKKYSLHAKIMITFSIVLVLLGAAAFYLLEASHCFSHLSIGEKILNAFFASVSPRTAGFNTVPLNEMSSAGKFLTMLLMFIGAGPGSTGGGIKVTTFIILFLTVHTYAKNQPDLSIFKKRLPADIPRKAFSNISFYLLAILTCVFCLLTANPDLPSESCLFEAISAMGTVGLTLGITSDLGTFSKICLMILMYLGRLGSIAVAMALVRRKTTPKVKYPEEKILIG